MAENFTGTNPVVPVFQHGRVKYAHNQKELDKFTKPPEDGGEGGETAVPRLSWPKCMSHPFNGDVNVNNEAEMEKRISQGYNFDHWENGRTKQIALLRQQLSAARMAGSGPLALTIQNQLEEIVGGGSGGYEPAAAQGSFNPAAEVKMNAQAKEIEDLKANNAALAASIDEMKKMQAETQRLLRDMDNRKPSIPRHDNKI